MVESRTDSPSKGSTTAKGMGRPHEFFDRGVQYYVMARQALHCRYPSVAGSLFHQGFEMILKASILDPVYEECSPGWTPGQPQETRTAAVAEYSGSADKLLANRGIGHKLPEAWRQFKTLHPGCRLDAFDDVVDELHKWWDVRYPGFPNGQALQLSSSLFKGGRPVIERPQPVDEYHLCLEETDELFAAIALVDYTLHAVRLAIEGGGGGSGVEAYQQDNRHSLW